MCRPGDERKVVRQARVVDREVLPEGGVLPHQPVERRCGRVSDHLARLLVLEHDQDHVLEVGDRSTRCAEVRIAGHGRPQEGECKPGGEKGEQGKKHSRPHGDSVRADA